MKTAEAYARVTRDKMTMNNAQHFREQMLSLLKPDEDECTIRIIAQRAGRKHSDKQRGYYFGCIVDIFGRYIAEHAGEMYNSEHHEQAHEVLKYRCNPMEVCGIVIGGSTTSMSTVDREQYHERCRDYLTVNFGLNIPLPNEQVKIFCSFEH